MHPSSWESFVRSYNTWHKFILSLRCIIGRFSNMGVFSCFVNRERLCCHIWSIFLVINAKQNQSSCWFSFNLLCEWFFDRFHQKIEVNGQILRWEWRKETPCLGARSGSLNKTLVSQHPLDSSLGVDARDCGNETQHCIFCVIIILLWTEY